MYYMIDKFSYDFSVRQNTTKLFVDTISMCVLNCLGTIKNDSYKIYKTADVTAPLISHIFKNLTHLFIAINPVKK